MSSGLKVRAKIARSAAPAVKATPRPRVKRERSIEAACREIAKARGCKFIKNNPRHNIGITDRLVVLPRAWVWWVEFKRPGEPLRPAQHAQIMSLRAMGLKVDAIDSAVFFRDVLDELLRRL